VKIIENRQYNKFVHSPNAGVIGLLLLVDSLGQ
jgi:hypothetical protein